MCHKLFGGKTAALHQNHQSFQNVPVHINEDALEGLVHKKAIVVQRLCGFAHKACQIDNGAVLLGHKQGLVHGGRIASATHDGAIHRAAVCGNYLGYYIALFVRNKVRCAVFFCQIESHLPGTYGKNPAGTLQRRSSYRHQANGADTDDGHGVSETDIRIAHPLEGGGGHIR